MKYSIHSERARKSVKAAFLPIMLFNSTHEWIIRKALVNFERGVSFDSFIINNLRYADDTTLRIEEVGIDVGLQLRIEKRPRSW